MRSAEPEARPGAVIEMLGGKHATRTGIIEFVRTDERKPLFAIVLARTGRRLDRVDRSMFRVVR